MLDAVCVAFRISVVRTWSQACTTEMRSAGYLSVADGWPGDTKVTMTVRVRSSMMNQTRHRPAIKALLALDRERTPRRHDRGEL